MAARANRGIESLRANYEPDDQARPRSAALGPFAALLAVAGAVLVTSGIGVSLAHDYALGTTLGTIAVGTTAVAFLLGLTALVSDRGRVWAIAAMLLAVIANPLVLTKLLGWFGGLG